MIAFWATRGHEWGNRLLRKPAVEKPLEQFEAHLALLSDEDDSLAPIPGGYALRFTDPEGRHDRAGRPIHHEVVVLDEPGPPPVDLNAAVSRVWPEIRNDYARLWGNGNSPSA